MKGLILTSQSGTELYRTELADAVVCFTFRFVWGPLPSVEELASYLAEFSDSHGPGTHWSTYAYRWPRDGSASKALGLVELCRRCEVVELWFDPSPNDQLQLVWLLDYLHFHPDIVPRLRLRLVDFDLIRASPEELGRWQTPAVGVTRDELDTASAAWQAYRTATPQACFDLLGRNLSALLLLKPALLDLLEELPSRATGLGATEMRLLELIARGNLRTNGLFYLSTLRQRRVFQDLEIGSLLEGLGHVPRPAIAGLDDELRTLAAENHRGRHEAYQRSQLSLTEFGRAILAHREDFSRYNPVHRWWGGTELTNDRLWRFDPVLIAPSQDGPGG